MSKAGNIEQITNSNEYQQVVSRTFYQASVLRERRRSHSHMRRSFGRNLQTHSHDVETPVNR